MRFSKTWPVLGIIVLILSACSAPAAAPTATSAPVSPTSAPATATEMAMATSAPPSPTPENTPTEVAVVDACVSCHTDKDQLILTAKVEEEVPQESEGAG